MIYSKHFNYEFNVMTKNNKISNVCLRRYLQKNCIPKMSSHPMFPTNLCYLYSMHVLVYTLYAFINILNVC